MDGRSAQPRMPRMRSHFILSAVAAAGKRAPAAG